MVRLLRWTGAQPVTFMNHGVGEVQPDAEFPVPDDAAAGFLAHGGVVDAGPDEQAPAKGARKAKSGAAKTAAEPATDTSGEQPAQAVAASDIPAA